MRTWKRGRLVTKDSFVRIALALAGGAIAFLALDTGYRFWSRSRLRPTDRVVYLDEDLGGYWHRSNSVYTVDYRGSGPHAVSFNAHGFRGTRSPAVAKPPEVTRIAVIGGSSVEDCGAADGRSWPEVLERCLAEAIGSNRVEVLNLGSSGATLRQSLKVLVAKGLVFKPDIVLSYNGNNDFWYAFGRLPGVTIRETWVDYEARSASRLERLLCKSIILDHLNRARYYRGRRRNQRYLHDYHRAPPDTHIYVDMHEHTAWLRDALCDFIELARSEGFLPVVVEQGSSVTPELRSDLLYAMWEVIRRQYRGKDVSWQTYSDGLTLMNEIQHEFAVSNGIPVFAMDSCVPKDMAHYLDHVHFREEGSRMAGVCIARGLLEHPATRARLLGLPAPDIEPQ